jgi:hypothetical protein
MDTRKIVMDIMCLHCKKPHSVTVVAKDLDEWMEGVSPKRHAQVAFPYLSVSDRELLISKTCDSCWNRMFPPEEDED